MRTWRPAYWRLEFDEARRVLKIQERTREAADGIGFNVGRRFRWRTKDLICALNKALVTREVEEEGSLGPVVHISVRPHVLFNGRVFARWCRDRNIGLAHREVDYFFIPWVGSLAESSSDDD